MPVGVPQIEALQPSKGVHRRRTGIVYRYALNFAIVAATGCGGEVAVRGHVTADGKPVHAGTITFQQTDHSGPAIGGPVKDGEFDLGKQKDLTAGKYEVTLEGFQTTVRTINDYQRGSIPETVPLTLAEKTIPVQISQANAHDLTLDFHTRKPK